ncbi:putative phosphoglycerate mutase [Kribbella amoyensis]|uniref:Putative phosphoglycerate mutase n=1 Tax=Kribbella amoyensis TaxID=996641 RepID=A0A561C145_9ACTN|nr:histidine phosphatase family protein [Kribbella amoyensis]TWD84777.1 putative phosphoglycerate mutase [Kribbella amoyensis]
MPGSATRYLYLARHGEATPDESALSENGRQQAGFLGDRLRDVPLSAISHGPLPRAAQTAQLIADRLEGVPVRSAEAAGDYIPCLPQEHELPPESAEYLLAWLDRVPPDELESGAGLAREAMELFTGPVPGDLPDHQLVVTHNFLIAWLVRAALDGPRWRWLGLAHCNAALTVIRYPPDQPAGVLVYNDMTHLPEQLRWTGFPAELRV